MVEEDEGTVLIGRLWRASCGCEVPSANRWGVCAQTGVTAGAGARAGGVWVQQEATVVSWELDVTPDGGPSAAPPRNIESCCSCCRSDVVTKYFRRTGTASADDPQLGASGIHCNLGAALRNNSATFLSALSVRFHLKLKRMKRSDTVSASASQ